MILNKKNASHILMKESGGSSYLPLAQRMIILGEMVRWKTTRKAYLGNHKMSQIKLSNPCLSGNGKKQWKPTRKAYLENHTDLSDQGAQSMEMEKANLECLSGNGKSNGNTKIIPGKPQDLSVWTEIQKGAIQDQAFRNVSMETRRYIFSFVRYIF